MSKRPTYEELEIQVQALKKTEEALRDSEEKYSKTFESITDSITITRIEDGRYLYVNDGFCNQTGYSSEEVIGNRPTDINLYINPEERERFIAILKEYGQVKDFVVSFRRKNGDSYYSEFSAKPLLYGGEECLLAQSRDIADRKRAEMALEENEAKQRAMIANISDVIAIIDQNGITQYKSPNIKYWFGWHAEDLVGVSTWENVHPDDISNMQAIFSQLIEKPNMTKTVESRYRCKDLSYKWIEVTAVNLLHDPDIRGILLNYHDISERKQAEVALKKSEARLRSIFMAAKEISIILTDTRVPEPTVLEFSPGAEKIFGYNRVEMIGTAVSLLHMSKDIERFSNVREQMREGKDGFSGETTLVRKSGEQFPALLSTDPLFDEEGMMYATLDVSVDLSDQKRLEAQLRQAQKMEAIGTLAGGIAHDFNNILFPLVGYSEMLKEDIAEDSPQQESIDGIISAAFRARDLVKQILTFSRQNDQGQKIIKLQPIINEALSLLRSSIPTTIEIEGRIQTGCGAVFTDSTEIHQIVMNLATNAYHAMEDTGGILKVELKQVYLETAQPFCPKLAPGQYARLTVTDTGSGIKKEIMDKIFNPYFTTKEVNKGTGMGLPIVQGIIKGCNGNLHIESEPGTGTKVKVYLPITDCDSKVVQTDPGGPVPEGIEHILLVDDEVAIVKMVKQLLERLGYHLTTCTGGVEALETFKSCPDSFALIITDMAMPQMTGVQLTKEIRNIKPEVPIILCTGFSGQIDEEKSEALGIQGFLKKPVTRRELAETIRKVIDMSKGTPQG